MKGKGVSTLKRQRAAIHRMEMREFAAGAIGDRVQQRDGSGFRQHQACSRLVLALVSRAG